MTHPIRLQSHHHFSDHELKKIADRLSSLQLEMNTPLRILSLDRMNLALIQARSLLQSLPAHLDEVRRRTDPSSLFELRVTLFALIDSDLMSLGEADQLAPLFRVIGLEELERAMCLWLEHEWAIFEHDQSPSQLTRVERGLASIFHSERGHEMFALFSEEERVLLSGPWVRPMMRLAGHERFPKQALLSLYRSTSSELRDLLIQQFERCRRRVHADPLPTYDLLLPTLNFSELNLLFAHWTASGELLAMTPYIGLFPKEVQLAFNYAACSESDVS